VGLKAWANGGLVKLTGYKLVNAERLRRPPSRPRPRRKPESARRYDEEAQRIMNVVRPRTMTAYEKLYALILATRYVVDRKVAGAIVECGVWRGGSMQAVAYTLLARDVADRELHLFDTFEGMPEPGAEDRRHDGTPASHVLDRSDKSANVWAIASLEDVREGMTETGYPEERLHYHRGLVEETIPGSAPETIALLRLDTDWYASTRHELEHLYDRVPAGGVILFDDYDFWQGARQAVDEFLARTGEQLLLIPMASGRIAVKC
jgi:O-methyltransferase